MIHRYINENVIRSFNQDAFFNAEPFPWYNFDQFIMPSSFRELTEEFPPPAQFEKHQGLVRGHGQRPMTATTSRMSDQSTAGPDDRMTVV